MTLAGLGLTWIEGISTARFGVAVFIFLAVIALGMRSERQGKLEGRLRGMVNKTPKGAANAFHRSLTDPIRWLASQSLLKAVQQWLVHWFLLHSTISIKKQIQLKQAGLRARRAYLYLEVIRFALGIGLGLLGYLSISITDLLSLNPALAIMIVIVAIIAGLYLPEIYIKRRIKMRRAEFEANWDDAIGLLIICLDAGLSIEVALRRIARELAPTAPILAEELIITVTDLSLLSERRLAYVRLSERIDLPSVKSVTVALIQSEKQGASIAGSLRIISQTNRQNRVARAEERAAAMGPKMTVPMIVFFLPVIFVIIIAPLVMSANL